MLFQYYSHKFYEYSVNKSNTYKLVARFFERILLVIYFSAVKKEFLQSFTNWRNNCFLWKLSKKRKYTKQYIVCYPTVVLFIKAPINVYCEKLPLIPTNSQ